MPNCPPNHFFPSTDNGWNDIGYNFLIGDDGNAYEGRGWYTLGAHAQSYNDDAIGISMMGDFTSQMPSQAALDALDNLMGCGAEVSFWTKWRCKRPTMSSVPTTTTTIIILIII